MAEHGSTGMESLAIVDDQRLVSCGPTVMVGVAGGILEELCDVSSALIARDHAAGVIPNACREFGCGEETVAPVVDQEYAVSEVVPVSRSMGGI